MIDPVSKIQILPDVIANQIAAGEVVERPAAVVKELVENSIDSGAQNIIVKFSHGGKYTIIVADDGCGMNAEDASLAFERHATSKILKIEDINAIKTFGFRGEALPSIASVSKFTMRTRISNSQFGTEILFNGGKLMHSKECGTPTGTIIQVEQLFHNVPARRLFLKTDQTEANLIINLVKNFALAERNIYFELHSDSKKIFQSPVNNDWPSRINEIFFENEHLLPIFFEKNACKIEGAIGDPTYGMPSKKFFSFFVNRRLVDSKLLKFVVGETLTAILPKYREAIACLLITIDPKFVDVNVHPTKKEIRFRNEQFIRACVSEAISTALNKNLSTSSQKNDQTNNINSYIHPQIKTSNYISNYSEESDILVNRKVTLPKILPNRPILHETCNFLEEKNKFGNKDTNSWNFIGQLFDDCALFESESGMIIVNLKLATIKIVFEQLKTNTQPNDIQTLLFPIDISTNEEEKTILEKLVPFLSTKGIEVYQFGKNQYRISGIPVWLSPLDTENLIRDLMAESVNYDSINFHLDNKKFAILASKYAKYEHKTKTVEIENLINKLLLCENCSLCPNGYSTFFEIPKCDFLKRFGKL